MMITYGIEKEKNSVKEKKNQVTLHINLSCIALCPVKSFQQGAAWRGDWSQQECTLWEIRPKYSEPQMGGKSHLNPS